MKKLLIVALLIPVVFVLPVLGENSSGFWVYESGYTLQMCIWGNCFFGTFLPTENGVSSTLQVAPQTVVSGETIAEWIGLDRSVACTSSLQTCHYWVQVGISVGSQPDNTFTATPIFYIESQSATSYLFRNMGAAAWNTPYNLQIVYSGGSNYAASLNGALLGTVYNWDLPNGQVNAFSEDHEPGGWNTQISAHWSNLQYYEIPTVGSGTWHPFGQEYVIQTCGGATVYAVSPTEFTVGMPPHTCGGGGGGGRHYVVINQLLGPPGWNGNGQNGGGAPMGPFSTPAPLTYVLVFLPLIGIVGLFLQRRIRQRGRNHL
jgi:hypothetical protein